MISGSKLTRASQASSKASINFAQEKESWRGVLVAGAYLAVGVLAGVGGMYIGEALLAATIVAAIGLVRRGGLLRYRVKLNLLLVLALLVEAWFCVSRLWSPEKSWHTSIGVLLGIPVLACFPWIADSDNAADRKLVLRAAIAGFFLAAAELVAKGVLSEFLFAKFDHSFHANVFAFKPAMSRGSAALAIWLWPVVAILDGAALTAIASAVGMIALTILVGILGHSSATLVAVLVGGFGYFAARAYPAATIGIGGIGASSALLATPRLAENLFKVPAPILAILPPSYFHRVQIWKNATALIGEKPWFGWGLDASKTFKEPHDYGYLGVRSLIPLHPHNGALQIWLETGIVGTALVSALLLSVALKLSGPLGRSPRIAAGSFGAAGSFCVFASVSFSVWQIWLWAALAAAVGVLFVQQRTRLSH